MLVKVQCKSCRGVFVPNVRLKGNQDYCSKKSCQQSRKNKWERDKCKKDSSYAENRKLQKQKWYNKATGSLYQKEYRNKHPDYTAANVNRQRNRNKASKTFRIITLTDQGLAELLKQNPSISFLSANCSTANIVKTDALISATYCLPAP